MQSFINTRYLRCKTILYRDEIRGLENKLAQLEDRIDEVKNLTAIAAAKSSAVSQEALDLLILDLTLPTVDLEQLRQQVETVSNEVIIIL